MLNCYYFNGKLLLLDVISLKNLLISPVILEETVLVALKISSIETFSRFCSLSEKYPQDIEIITCCPAGSVLEGSCLFSLG